MLPLSKQIYIKCTCWNYLQHHLFQKITLIIYCWIQKMEFDMNMVFWVVKSSFLNQHPLLKNSLFSCPWREGKYHCSPTIFFFWLTGKLLLALWLLTLQKARIILLHFHNIFLRKGKAPLHWVFRDHFVCRNKDSYAQHLPMENTLQVFTSHIK